MAPLVRDLMTSRVVTVRSDEPLSAVVERMTRFGFSALPVVSPSFRLVGMVSLLDVLRFREEHDAEGAEADGRVRVEEIMSPDVLSMSPTANVSVVAQRLRSHGELRVMPVVQGGRLVGVVTRGDLLRHLDLGSLRTGQRRLFGGRDKPEDALFALEQRRRTGPPPVAATPVQEVMTREVITVGSAERVAVAAEVMLHHRHSALPVVDGENRLVGIISEADILADPLAGRSAHTTVNAVMTRAPITVDAGATVGEARALVADRGMRTVPVVDGDRLVGVLSRSDLL
ncbi:CBS domain-containing protein [Pseudonocardia xinjiangensis]|nr:CBS domain-containing protein [Pseudonocardia xinjiangensis]